jgi:hypothetical protein
MKFSRQREENNLRCFAWLNMTDYGRLATRIFELSMQRFNPSSVARAITGPPIQDRSLNRNQISGTP